MHRHPCPADRRRSEEWARRLLARTDWAILDTETTGLDATAEAVQISVVAPDGTVLLSTLLRPTRPIPPEVTAIHGITDEMVADAPTFPEVRGVLAELLEGRTVIAYNSDFDARILHQTAAVHTVQPLPIRWDCAMHAYATYHGERKNRGYRWQKLPRQPHRQAHDATGDALACLDVIRLMAGEEMNPDAQTETPDLLAVAGGQDLAPRQRQALADAGVAASALAADLDTAST